jgi:general stress protein 26
MSTEAEIAARFWKALRSERTIMLGLVGARDGHMQPMTAILEGERDAGPVWIFSARNVDLVKALAGGSDAAAQFVAKDHSLFATIHGRLEKVEDKAMVDRLWNPFIAAWYPGGKSDPDIRLLRFDPGHAQIWLNENSVFAGIKLVLGKDPRKEYADKVAEVDLAG